jgi:hypothetical protein
MRVVKFWSGHMNKHNSSETYWSMSSVSQAARKQQSLSLLPKKKKKKQESRTFVLSESLVFVDYDRVLVLGGHCGTKNTAVVKDKVRHRFGANCEPRLKLTPNLGKSLSRQKHPFASCQFNPALLRGGGDSLYCSFFTSIGTEEPNRQSTNEKYRPS